MEKAETPKSIEANDKRQKLNGILLKAIIGILLADAVIGSVLGLVALISGNKALFEEHNYLIIYAVIADIVFWITASIIISKRMVAKREAKEQARIEEEERLESERQKKIEQERIEREKHLEEQRKIEAEKARIDGLTGLYLKRFFLGKLYSEIERAKRYKTNFYLMMLDIDHFKKVNDTYGHLIGD